MLQLHHVSILYIIVFNRSFAAFLCYASPECGMLYFPVVRFIKKKMNDNKYQMKHFIIFDSILLTNLVAF